MRKPLYDEYASYLVDLEQCQLPLESISYIKKNNRSYLLFLEISQTFIYRTSLSVPELIYFQLHMGMHVDRSIALC